MTPPTQETPKTGLVKYAARNKFESGALMTSVLLGTTSLATPLLNTTIGAGALMAATFLLVMKTSDTVVDNAAALGRKMKISPLALGLGLGVLTSMPELLVTFGAVRDGAAELGIGNIVGSNIANILLILGITAAITPIAKGSGLGWKFNTAVMAGTTGFFAAQLALGAMTPVLGGLMMGGLAAYLGASYVISKRDTARNSGPQTDDDAPAKAAHPVNMSKGFNVGWGLLGVGGLIFAADLLVGSATKFASGIGISEAVIGALAVAVGTSLPEMMVNIKSALKKNTDLAIGNILGSNVFNVLMVGGVVAMSGVAVPAAFALTSTMGILNLAAFGASAALLTGVLARNGGGMKRGHGFAFAGLYTAFAAATMMLSDTPKDKAAQLPAPQTAQTQMIDAPAKVARPLLPAPSVN